jgi:predicted PurR-regulated permease PerM
MVSSATQRRALGWSAIAAVAVILWLVRSVAVGIIFGALTGFALQPLHERIGRHLRPMPSALFTVLATTIGIVTSVGGFGYLLITQGVQLTRGLLAALGPGGSASTWVERLTDRAASFGFSPQFIEAKVRDGAAGAAAGAARIAELIAAASSNAMLGLFFMMLAMYFVLRHWPRIATRAAAALPLRPDYTHSLFAEFRRVGRTTLLGTVATGLAQGVLATIGYAIAGAPDPLFFGATTALASLIPAVGTLLVWVPLGVVLILTGHAAHGVLELVWGAAIVVGISDYVVRPRLVKGGGGTPALVTFAALFGGVDVFGLEGLILGPVLMSMAVAILRIYGQELERDHANESRSSK